MKRRESIKNLIAGLGLVSIPAAAVEDVLAFTQSNAEPRYLDDSCCHVVIEGWVVTVDDLKVLERLYAN